MSLVEAIDARGLVAVVGAGGKKSTMYRLADEFDRAVVTATVRIPIFDPHVQSVTVTDDPVRAVNDATRVDFPLGVVPGREGDDRYVGYDPAVVDRLAAAVDLDAVLIKADGARMRKFKAPGENEPRIPSKTDVVVPVVSAHVVGEPLSDELVHRVDHVSSITGLSVGESIGAEAIATVILDADGGCKGVPSGATVVPVINMVDDDRLQAHARDVANAIIEHGSISRVVLSAMTASDPVVEVVE